MPSMRQKKFPIMQEKSGHIQQLHISAQTINIVNVIHLGFKVITAKSEAAMAQNVCKDMLN